MLSQYSFYWHESTLLDCQMSCCRPVLLSALSQCYSHRESTRNKHWQFSSNSELSYSIDDTLSKTNSHFSSPFTFLLLPPSLPVSLPLRLPLSPTLFLPSIQLQDDINHNGLEVLSIYVQKYIDVLSKSECKSYTPIFVCTSSSPSVFDHRGRPGIWQEHIRMGD